MYIHHVNNLTSRFQIADTTTMPYMRLVIEALKKTGKRQDIIVMVGGAPLNDAFAEDIEADSYCRDAAVAVETAKKLMQIKRA